MYAHLVPSFRLFSISCHATRFAENGFRGKTFRFSRERTRQCVKYTAERTWSALSILTPSNRSGVARTNRNISLWSTSNKMFIGVYNGRTARLSSVGWTRGARGGATYEPERRIKEKNGFFPISLSLPFDSLQTLATTALLKGCTSVASQIHVRARACDCMRLLPRPSTSTLLPVRSQIHPLVAAERVAMQSLSCKIFRLINSQKCDCVRPRLPTSAGRKRSVAGGVGGIRPRVINHSMTTVMIHRTTRANLYTCPPPPSLSVAATAVMYSIWRSNFVKPFECPFTDEHKWVRKIRMCLQKKKKK